MEKGTIIQGVWTPTCTQSYLHMFTTFHNALHTAARGMNGRTDYLWQPETVELSKAPESFEGRSDSFFQSYEQFDKIRSLGKVGCDLDERASLVI